MCELTEVQKTENTTPSVQLDSGNLEPASVMTYEDAEGQHREEPACASCIRRFSWTASQKAVIEKVLRYHYMMEEYETEVWNTLTSLYSNSDYWATCQINALLSALVPFPVQEYRAVSPTTSNSWRESRRRCIGRASWQESA